MFVRVGGLTDMLWPATLLSTRETASRGGYAPYICSGGRGWKSSRGWTHALPAEVLVSLYTGTYMPHGVARVVVLLFNEHKRMYVLRIETGDRKSVV